MLREMAVKIFQQKKSVIVHVIIGGKIKQHFKKYIGRTLKRYEMRPLADKVKKLISQNLRLGREYTGKPAAKLSDEWIKEKTRKKRNNPRRVFYDKGMLVNGLRITPKIDGYNVAFKPYTYPETRTSMNDVAFYLHTGGGDLPERPFFGLTNRHFKDIVSSANIQSGIDRAVKSQARRVAKKQIKGKVAAINLRGVFKDTEQKNSSDRYSN